MCTYKIQQDWLQLIYNSIISGKKTIQNYFALKILKKIIAFHRFIIYSSSDIGSIWYVCLMECHFQLVGWLSPEKVLSLPLHTASVRVIRQDVLHGKNPFLVSNGLLFQWDKFLADRLHMAIYYTYPGW